MAAQEHGHKAVSKENSDSSGPNGDVAASFAEARAAMAAVVGRVDRFSRSGGKNEREEAIALCYPLASLLYNATVAAAKAKSRRDRSLLKPDVERTSSRLDSLAEFLTMEPKLTWHATFAATFDAENRLRATLGLSARPRPYSGLLDPKAAVEQVAKSSQGGQHGTPRPTRFENPQQAAAGIGLAVQHVFDRQMDAVQNAKENLHDKEPPKQPSLGEVVLKSLAMTALNLATAHVGSMAATAIKSALAGRSVVAQYGIALAQELSSEEKIAAAIKGGGMGGLTQQAADVVLGAAPGAAKALFTTLVANAHKTVTEVAAGVDPINAFMQRQHSVLQMAKTNALMEFTALTSALEQADVEILTAVVQALLVEVANTAYREQYASAIMGYQNYKAVLMSGSLKPGAEKPIAKLGDERIAGVLEVNVVVDPISGDIELKKLELAGAEFVAYKHIKAQATPIANLGLNQRITASIKHGQYLVDGEMKYVGLDMLGIGVGADGKVQIGTLNATEKRILKAYATRKALDGATVAEGASGAFDHLPDAVALLGAKSIAFRAGRINSRNLEKGE